ncbi:phage tail protein [Streptomyces fulvoviolaceus]|uniref:phage tail protein n=1 Tax=Streptomyces fulvoviolaceus TaxID=285535 RepID=UPI00131AD99F|nr:phage tail protein [Streptomyces fulvoviolaceus]MCT9078063.1 phage tail protein [Streptomyces fulvoviolaceus]
MTAMNPVVDLAALGFTACTDPLGPAVRLSWNVSDPAVRIRVLRRERRFPGTARRGWVPVPAATADLTDGVLVHDSADFPADVEETRSEWEAGTLVATTRFFRYRGTPRDRHLVGLIRRTTAADGTPLATTAEIIDGDGVLPGTRYYYTAFAAASGLYSRATQASALATGRYGTALFAALPQADRVRDTVSPAPFTVAREDADKGQLQRFVEIVEAHADLLRGQVEELAGLHDPRRVDARLLPYLARHIGWRLKDYLDEDAQRGEVMFAPEFYRTVGTVSNITAMINRLTGWDAQVREFVRNVLAVFDTSRLEPVEGGRSAYADGSTRAHDGGPPYLDYRTAPPGSLDTTDAQAMYRLRNRLIDDTAAYSYDCGRPRADGGYDRDDRTWYSRDTIGVYIVPDVATEAFVLQAEWERIRAILREFLPVNIRAVFVLMPSVVVEEEYDAVAMATEEAGDRGVLLQEERYGEGSDTGADAIAGWRRFLTNSAAHCSVDTAAGPPDTASRSWHTGIS